MTEADDHTPGRFDDDLWAEFDTLTAPAEAEPDEDHEDALDVGAARPPALGAGATPLKAGFGYARRFPLEALPPNMAGYVADLAHRKQVPVDLPALTILGALGSIAGPRVIIRRDLDWMQPTNIYTCVGISSGGGKSPTVAEIRSGMLRAKKKLAERHDAKLARRIAELRTETDDLRTQALDIVTPIDEKERLRFTATAKEREADELEKDPPPPPDLIIDGDTSPEALGETMAVNDGCGPLIDDEGTFFRNLAGQYNGKTGNLSLVLVGYDCRYYRPKRATRTAAGIPRAALSLVISPQPSLIASAMRNQLMDELGFINRFIVCVPGDLVGQRLNRPSVYYKDAPEERPDRRGQQWWAELVERLIGQYEVIGDTDEDEAPTINLTRAAHKLHYEYGELLEKRCHPQDGDLRKISPWATKHAARVLRIAALLHLAAGFTVERELAESTMEDAIVIGDWAIEHFIAAGTVAGLTEEAGRIKEFVDGTDVGCASRTTLFRDLFKGHVAAKDLSAWIEELVATGEYEETKVVGPNGGRPRDIVRRRRAK